MIPHLQQLADYYGLADGEGFVPTGVPGVRFFQSTQAVARTPVLYQPGIAIIGQGQKIGHLEDQVIRYDADNYLVLTVPLPLECETRASKDKPLLGIFIDININRLVELVAIVSQETSLFDVEVSGSPTVIGAVPLHATMRQTVVRLLECLTSKVECQVLGPSIVREIIYRVLCGPKGSALYTLAQHTGHYARVARVLNRIHTEYDKPLTVDELASAAGMSTSAFHRAFKDVVSDSPMQYLKKVRLNKAKSLIVQDGMRVNAAAHRVGYESVSQFSRDFKRYFNVPPRRSAEIGYASIV